jgi:GMP synthase-like glutamine amidotransferase
VKVGVIADEGDDDEGFVGERLAMHGALLHKVWRDDPHAVVGAAAGVDLLLLLGSDRSVHDRVHREVVAAEQETVRRADAAGVPVLAICYGAQLAASALGAPVSRAPRPEIGWVTIEGATSALCPPGPWFQLHYDCFGEIPGVAPLAVNEVGAQGFLHRRILGVQFHPEVTGATATGWLEGQAPRLQRLGIDVAAVVEETAALEAGARLRCHELVDHFLSEVATPADLAP